MESLSDLFPGLDVRVVLQDILGVGELIENGDEYIHSCPLPFGMHKNGDRNPSASINKDTFLFNNVIGTKAELLEKWLVPLKDSWMADRVSFSEL